jgi:hypothetical protein
MSILSLYCTSYTCECILTVLKAVGCLDNGCDSRDFLFGRTIIDTERRVGEVQVGFQPHYVYCVVSEFYV